MQMISNLESWVLRAHDNPDTIIIDPIDEDPTQ